MLKLTYRIIVIKIHLLRDLAVVIDDQPNVIYIFGNLLSKCAYCNGTDNKQCVNLSTFANTNCQQYQNAIKH